MYQSSSREKIYGVSEQKFKEVFEKANSIQEALIMLGFSPERFHGNANKIFQKRCEELGIDMEPLKERAFQLAHQSRPVFSMEEILVENSPYTASSHLYTRLIKEGYKEARCEKCGITEWMGNPISFQIHHKNGAHNDNRIENIQILCPNCHSQTDNYTGKNTKKAKENASKPPYSRHKTSKCIDCGKPIYAGSLRCPECYAKTQYKVSHVPTREELKGQIRKLPFTKVGEIYGISDNSIRKWCIKFGLPSHKRDINSYTDKEWEAL